MSSSTEEVLKSLQTQQKWILFELYKERSREDRLRNDDIPAVLEDEDLAVTSHIVTRLAEKIIAYMCLRTEYRVKL